MNSNKIIKYIKDLFISIKSISNHVIYYKYIKINYKHNKLLSNLNILNIKTLYLSLILSVLLIYSFIINISSISNSYAGGGGSYSPSYCNNEGVRRINRSGMGVFYYNVDCDLAACERQACTPYSPPLPTWEEIAAHEYSKNDVKIDIKVPMTSNSNGYVILDKEYSDQLLRENGSCNTDDGAERFIVRGVGMNIKNHIKVQQCVSFRVGIEKKYLDTIPNTNYIDRSKLKIFCDKAIYVDDRSKLHKSFFYRYFSWSLNPIYNTFYDYFNKERAYICRDGKISSLNDEDKLYIDLGVSITECYPGIYNNFSGMSEENTKVCSTRNITRDEFDRFHYYNSPSVKYKNLGYKEFQVDGIEPIEVFNKDKQRICHVATTYKVGCKESSRNTSCTSYWGLSSDGICEDYGTSCTYRYYDKSTYDNRAIVFDKYNIDMCIKPIINKDIKIENGYDPNLLLIQD